MWNAYLRCLRSLPLLAAAIALIDLGTAGLLDSAEARAPGGVGAAQTCVEPNDPGWAGTLGVPPVGTPTPLPPLIGTVEFTKDGDKFTRTIRELRFDEFPSLRGYFELESPGQTGEPGPVLSAVLMRPSGFGDLILRGETSPDATTSFVLEVEFNRGDQAGHLGAGTLEMIEWAFSDGVRVATEVCAFQVQITLNRLPTALEIIQLSKEATLPITARD